MLKTDGVARDVISNIRIAEHAPKAAILTAADDFQVDLIVMGSHRHSVISDAPLGSTTMKILHSAKVPVGYSEKAERSPLSENDRAECIF